MSGSIDPVQQAFQVVQNALSSEENAPAIDALRYLLQQATTGARTGAALSSVSERLAGIERQQQRTQPTGGNPLGVKLKVEKPPTFDGTSSKLNNWKFLVQQYLQIVGVLNENTMAKYAVALLEGKALTWWRGQVLSQPTVLEEITLTELFELLGTEFEDVDRELKLRRKLQNLRQRESVQKYAALFRSVQLELGPQRLDDNAAVFQFLEGLRDEVRTQVLLQRPESFADAVILAERADAALRFAQGNRRFQNPRQRGGNDRGPAPMDLDNVTGGNNGQGQGQRPDPRKKNSQRDPIICYRCGKPGHIRANCRVKLPGPPAQPPGYKGLNNMDLTVEDTPQDHDQKSEN